MYRGVTQSVMTWHVLLGVGNGEVSLGRVFTRSDESYLVDLKGVETLRSTVPVSLDRLDKPWPFVQHFPLADLRGTWQA